MSLPRFGRYLPRCTARLMTPKVGTAFNILLELYPCSACDKMRLGHLRFSHETELTKAKTVTGRRPRQAGQTRPQPNSGTLPKHARHLIPVVGLGAPQVASKVVRRLAGARSEARRGSAMQIAGNRGDMRCESDQSSAPDLGPGACRTPQQEHRRRSRHQPAHGRHHRAAIRRRRLEVPPDPDPHSDCCRLGHKTARAAGSGFLAMTSK